MWDTIGHNKVRSLLESSLSGGRLAHAYLFVGPPHVGKMTLARDLARALNCESTAPPCGECAPCLRIAAGKHSDILEQGLSKSPEGKTLTEINVEDIKRMQHWANLPPFEGKRKVFVIDGAEMLSLEAANRLLKTLEEPAERVVFILLTVQEDLLPATVVSRCQRIELMPMPAPQVEKALIDKWSVPPETARLLARLSHGCLGWAVSAVNDGSLERHHEMIDEITGISGGDLESRFAYAAQMATEFGQSRERVQQKLGLWLEWWHDIFLVKTGLSDAIANVDRQAPLAATASRLSLGQIRSCIASIDRTRDQLKQNANARLALEVLMLDLPVVGTIEASSGTVAGRQTVPAGD
jgi:DNA polymerase-3 subunit delta'